jgi:hypothetical protein
MIPATTSKNKKINGIFADGFAQPGDIFAARVIPSPLSPLP